MRRLIKWLFLLPLILLAVAVGLVLSKDAIAKAAVEQQIRAQTGMDVKIGKFSLSLLSPVANLENITLYNPADFGGTPFLNIREMHVEFDREALTRRELRLKLLRVNVAELTVVRNDLGQTNIVQFAGVPAANSSGPTVAFKGVEVFNLSLQKVSYLDLGQQRNNRYYNVILRNQVTRDLKSAAEINQVLVRIWERKGG
jgi:uncharacterized protein involved in outer membrane biogenesis